MAELTEKEKFARLIKATRLNAGMTQKDFANMIKSSQNNYSTWETGARVPLATSLFTIAEALGKEVLITDMSEDVKEWFEDVSKRLAQIVSGELTLADYHKEILGYIQEFKEPT